MLFTRSLLRGMGFTSEIFVEHVAAGLGKTLRPWSEYRSAAEQILLVHHSIGHRRLDWLLSLKDEKVLVYHNITPLRYVTGHRERESIQLGQQQLADLARSARSVISVSRFNLRDLPPLGDKAVDVIPLLFDVERIRAAPFSWRIASKRGDCFRVLFVGRVLPHKRQDDLVETCYHLKRLGVNAVELVLVGHCLHPEFLNRVTQVARHFGIENCLRIEGEVSEEELWGWYRASDAFLCLSDHEGFGVPLIEAMALDVPVFAGKSGAIAETLGGAGVLFEKKWDLAGIAESMLNVYNDRGRRRALILGQRKRVSDFESQQMAYRLAEHLGLGEQAAGLSPALASPSEAWDFFFHGDGEFARCRVESEGLAKALLSEGARSVRFGPEEDLGVGCQVEAKGKSDLADTEAPIRSCRVLWPRWLSAARRFSEGDIRVLRLVSGDPVYETAWMEQCNATVDFVLTDDESAKQHAVDSGACVPIFVAGKGARAEEPTEVGSDMDEGAGQESGVRSPGLQQARCLMRGLESIVSGPLRDHYECRLAWLCLGEDGSLTERYSQAVLRELGMSRRSVQVFNIRDYLRQDKEAHGERDRLGMRLPPSLAKAVAGFDPHVAVIQCEADSPPAALLPMLLGKLQDSKVSCVVDWHGEYPIGLAYSGGLTADLSRYLDRCHRLITRRMSERDSLRELGLRARVAVIPWGGAEPRRFNRHLEQERLGLLNRPVLAGEVSRRPWLEVRELLLAFETLKKDYPRASLLLLDQPVRNVDGGGLAGERERLLARSGVAVNILHLSRLLTEEQMLRILAAADCCLFPHRSSSFGSDATLHAAMAVGSPVVCTPQHGFDDAGEAVRISSGTDARSMAASVKQILQDSDRREVQIARQYAWIETRCWPQVALKLRAIAEEACWEQRMQQFRRVGH